MNGTLWLLAAMLDSRRLCARTLRIPHDYAVCVCLRCLPSVFAHARVERMRATGLSKCGSDMVLVTVLTDCTVSEHGTHTTRPGC